jgi:hypothetical protein
MLTMAYSIFQGNVGTAYRQRSQILVFYFIFVAVGAVLVLERRENRKRQELMLRQAAAAAAALPRRRATPRGPLPHGALSAQLEQAQAPPGAITRAAGDALKV